MVKTVTNKLWLCPVLECWTVKEMKVRPVTSMSGGNLLLNFDFEGISIPG